MKRLNLVGLFTAIALFAAATVQAAPITYIGFDAGANSTDPRPNSLSAYAAFIAAAGSVSTINFESTALGGFTNLNLGGGVTLSGGSGTEIRNTPGGVPDGLFGYNTTTGGANFLYTNAASAMVTFNFATPITSFGFFWTGSQTSGASASSIQFNDGSPQTIVLPANSLGGAAFVGFTNATPITSLRVSVPFDLIGIDDVTYSSEAVTAAPEPTSVMLFGSGALLLAARRRRRTQ